MVDLTKFAAGGELGSYLSTRRIERPWSRGGYSYATNGRILVRVDRRDDIAEEPLAPDCDALIDDADARGNYTWIKDIPDVEVKELACPGCRGTGEIRWRRSTPITCDECNGKKMVVSPQMVSFPMSVSLADVYVKLIKDELPGAEIGIVESKDRVPVKIRFNGGIGLLMPIRRG